MRLFLIIATTMWAATMAFMPAVQPTTTTSTKLDMVSRRQAMEVIAAFGLFPTMAGAFSQQLDDYAYEPAQQKTDGKIDLNSAFVGEYKELRGMFPTAAGKIASNGPYESVKDIYKIPGLTSRDKELFKKWEKEFTVQPPGRAFYERINGRVST